MSGYSEDIVVDKIWYRAFFRTNLEDILSDCVSSFDPELQAATLKNLDMKFAVVMSSTEFEEIAGRA